MSNNKFKVVFTIKAKKDGSYPLTSEQIKSLMEKEQVGFELLLGSVVPYYDFDFNLQTQDELKLKEVDLYKKSFNTVEKEYPNATIYSFMANGYKQHKKGDWTASYHFIVRNIGYYESGKCIQHIEGCDKSPYCGIGLDQKWRIPYCKKSENDNRIFKRCIYNEEFNILKTYNLNEIEEELNEKVDLYLVQNINGEKQISKSSENKSQLKPSIINDNLDFFPDYKLPEFKYISELNNKFSKYTKDQIKELFLLLVPKSGTQDWDWNEFRNICWCAKKIEKEYEVDMKDTIMKLSEMSDKHDEFKTEELFSVESYRYGNKFGTGFLINQVKEKNPEGWKKWFSVVSKIKQVSYNEQLENTTETEIFFSDWIDIVKKSSKGHKFGIGYITKFLKSTIKEIVNSGVRTYVIIDKKYNADEKLFYPIHKQVSHGDLAADTKTHKGTLHHIINIQIDEISLQDASNITRTLTKKEEHLEKKINDIKEEKSEIERELNELLEKKDIDDYSKKQKKLEKNIKSLKKQKENFEYKLEIETDKQITKETKNNDRKLALENTKKKKDDCIVMSKLFRDLSFEGKLDMYSNIQWYPDFKNDSPDASIFNTFLKSPMSLYKPKKIINFEETYFYKHCNNKLFGNNFVETKDGRKNSAWEFMKDLISLKLQQPRLVVGVCLLLYSKYQGAGKDIFHKLIRKMLGRHNAPGAYDTSSSFSSDFNAMQFTSLYLCINEAKGNSDSKKMNDFLNSVITREEGTKRVLYKDAESAKSYASVQINTNHHMYISPSDRRILAIDCIVDDEYDEKGEKIYGAGFTDYFKMIVDEINDNDFVYSAYTYFMNRKISREVHELYRAPDTTYKVQLRTTQCGIYTKFLLQLHKCNIDWKNYDGVYVQPRKNKIYINITSFYRLFDAYCVKNDASNRTLNNFEKNMKDLCVQNEKMIKYGKSKSTVRHLYDISILDMENLITQLFKMKKRFSYDDDVVDDEDDEDDENDVENPENEMFKNLEI